MRKFLIPFGCNTSIVKHFKTKFPFLSEFGEERMKGREARWGDGNVGSPDFIIDGRNNAPPRFAANVTTSRSLIVLYSGTNYT